MSDSLKTSGFSRWRKGLISIFLFSLMLCLPAKKSPAQTSGLAPDSLNRLIQKANEAWNNNTGDLGLAVKVLSEVTATGASAFYDLATTFYQFSLKHTSFSRDSAAIIQVANRTLPLVQDSVKSKWQNLLEDGDDQILTEIYAFWEKTDPYASTRTNERLLEHWNRIQYARKNYTRAKNTPYGTDDRGLYYVRFGPPDRSVTEFLHINSVMDPGRAGMFRFELGNVILSEVIIWDYSLSGRDFFLLFGKRKGWGQFGYREGLVDLLDTHGMRVELQFGNFLPDASMRDFTEQVILVGALEQLAPTHSYFERMNTMVRSRLSVNSGNSASNVINRYRQSLYFVNPAMKHHITRQVKEAPSYYTTVLQEDARLPADNRVFRLLGENDSTEYVLAFTTRPGKYHTNYDSYFISNHIFAYDDRWNTVHHLDDPFKIDASHLPNTSVYKLGEGHRLLNLYYASELIDTSRAGVFNPRKINPRASAIIATTGKKHLSLPPPLDRGEPLLVSDIILGFEQEGKYDIRVPITPVTDFTFRVNSRLMVFFEIYNIPDDGYQVSYHFEKKRWLGIFGYKKIKDKPTVTLLNESVGTRHSQNFSLPLSGLSEGEYHIVLKFKSLAGDDEPVKERKLNIEIIE